MDQVSIAHAKEHLEELIERARRGEDVRIADDKGVEVRLLPAEPPAHDRPVRRRRLGMLEGKIPPPPADFFDPMSEEELKQWYGDEA